MAARLALNGLDQLRDDLLRLPTDLADDADIVVQTITERTAQQLVATYPTGATGNLRAGVRTRYRRSKGKTTGYVVSTSPHAHLWEYGTQVRTTREGWNRGRMPSHTADGLVSIAMRNRRQLRTAVTNQMRHHGLTVSGSVN